MSRATSVVLFGNGKPALNLASALQGSGIKVIGLVQDIALNEGQSHFELQLGMIGVKLLQPVLRDLEIASASLCVVINYNKLIPISMFCGVPAINIHIGLLPKYKGNNANAWAVLNGETKVGYTVHEVSEKLDSGAIYYSFEYSIEKDETYAPAKQAIEQDLLAKLPSLIDQIVMKKIIPIPQESLDFQYGIRIRPSDGIIKNWDVPSDQLLRMNFVFGRPLGTGLRFQYKERTYCIEKISKISGYMPSIGIPGSVVFHGGSEIWIKTGDTAVRILSVSQEGREVDLMNEFKTGMRFQ